MRMHLQKSKIGIAVLLAEILINSMVVKKQLYVEVAKRFLSKNYVTYILNVNVGHPVR